MIPETGQVEDFREAMFEYCSKTPMVGEIYEWISPVRLPPHMEVISARWKITGREPGLIHYFRLDLDPVRGRPSTCTLDAWDSWVLRDKLKFIGYDT